MESLSIIIPFYDDLDEAIGIAETIRSQSCSIQNVEWILVGLDPARCGSPAARRARPENLKIVFCDSYRGLPHGKNRGLRESSGEAILFVLPGINPTSGSIEHLSFQLQTHPDWGAIAGRWHNIHGQVEKGYNIRRFPTYAALLFDLLLLNKLFPSNRITRDYKLHDFDHDTLCQAEHCNDWAFMARRQALLDLGGFDESYQFGWFDQVEMCRKLRQAGHKVYYDPGALFISTGREYLVDRLLAEHYVKFYRDEQRFVAKNFGTWQSRIFAFLLIVAMLCRLAFANALPSGLRRRLLRHYQTYVGDAYIQGMRDSYWTLILAVLRTGFKKGEARENARVSQASS